MTSTNQLDSTMDVGDFCAIVAPRLARNWQRGIASVSITHSKNAS